MSVNALAEFGRTHSYYDRLYMSSLCVTLIKVRSNGGFFLFALYLNKLKGSLKTFIMFKMFSIFN